MVMHDAVIKTGTEWGYDRRISPIANICSLAAYKQA